MGRLGPGSNSNGSKCKLAEDIRADRKVIETQLAEADRLDATDPAQPRKICQAIVTLYGDKPWAAAN